MLQSFDHLIIHPAVSMRDAVAQIQGNDIKILLVMETGSRALMGTITDGDIRRALLDDRDLATPARQIMNPKPYIVDVDVPRSEVVDTMKSRVLRHVPRINAVGDIVGIELLDDRTRQALFTNEVVIMAGGRGERLRPMTDTVPKPMLSVGGKPILEKIIEHMAAQGFQNFTISVNYLADMITEHFGDGSKFGVRIRYVRETKRLGTAGALSLLPMAPKQPFVVINGDILTRINFQDLIAFHADHGHDASICVREYSARVPFGVIETKDGCVERVVEKPEQRFLINAGIYTLNPSILNQVPRDEFFDMTDLINKLVDQKSKISAFHVDEDWLDIGHPDQLRQAQIIHKVAS